MNISSTTANWKIQRLYDFVSCCFGKDFRKYGFHLFDFEKSILNTFCFAKNTFFQRYIRFIRSEYFDRCLYLAKGLSALSQLACSPLEGYRPFSVGSVYVCLYVSHSMSLHMYRLCWCNVLYMTKTKNSPLFSRNISHPLNYSPT